MERQPMWFEGNRDSLIEYTVTVLILVVTPGAGFTLVVSAAAQHGHRAATGVAAGIVTGCLLPAAAAAAYVTTVAPNAEPLQALMRVLGAAFLAVLGYRALRNAVGEPTAVPVLGEQNVGALFRVGVIGTLVNPGIAAIYLIIIPQYALRSGSAALELAGIHMMLCGSWYLLIVFALRALSGPLTRPTTRRLLMMMAGMSLLYLAARTATFL